MNAQLSKEEIFFGTSGPRNARIMAVAESWGEQEAGQLKPLVGSSGQIFNQLLKDCGIPREEVFCTNVVSARPPQNNMWYWFEPAKGNKSVPLRGLHPKDKVLEGLGILQEQIRRVKPDVILALGNYALWALTNCTTYRVGRGHGRREPAGIMRWRGSMIYADALPEDLQRTRVLPLIHPEAIRKDWVQRAPTKHDISCRVPMALKNDWEPNIKPVFFAPPTFEQAKAKLNAWLTMAEAGHEVILLNDVETARGLLTCIGFADSPYFAMAIPFVKLNYIDFDSYWAFEEEFTLLQLIRKVLSHPNIKIEGQNYHYDTQYIEAYLACIPNYSFDSMTAHHTLFPRTPKGLDYLSSLYCRYHTYWKDDTKEWDVKGDLVTHLRYNCTDCCRNFEVNTVLKDLIVRMGQEQQWAEQMEENLLAARMMRRGIKIDERRRAMLAVDLTVAADKITSKLLKILPQELVDPKAKTPWYRSNKQQKEFFSEELGFRLPIDRKTKQPTLGKEGLRILKERHPEFTRMFILMEEIRRIGVFHNTFLKAQLDFGHRMRCMFKTSGTDTFRWASSANAFGRGTNLQNIPSGEEED